jgi:hypothetical protein
MTLGFWAISVTLVFMTGAYSAPSKSCSCAHRSTAPPLAHNKRNGIGVMLSMRSAGQWLAIDDQPRVWIARHELEASPAAPATPIEQWSETQMLGAMLEAISRRAGMMEVTNAPQQQKPIILQRGVIPSLERPL